MGVSIYGWVEVRDGKEWFGVINISEIIDDDYDMFGMLFGVKNYTGFEPIAEDRGLPEDISFLAKKDYDEWEGRVFGTTWVTWKELKQINWDEESPYPDGRVHIYIVQPDGSEKYYGKAWLISDLSEEDYKRIWKGEEIRKGKRVYRAERIRRRDILDRDWQMLFELMEVLAKYYGDENVRLVVWFVP